MFQGLNAHHQEANYIDAAPGIVLSVGAQFERELDDEHLTFRHRESSI